MLAITATRARLATTSPRRTHRQDDFAAVHVADQPEFERRDVAAGHDEDVRQIVIGKIAIRPPVVVIFLPLGILGSFMQQDHLFFQEKIEFYALIQLPVREVVVTDDLEPLVRQGIVFHETIAARHEFQAEIATLDRGFIRYELDQRRQPTGLAIHVVVIGQDAEREHCDGHEYADDDQHDEDFDKREAPGPDRVMAPAWGSDRHR